MKKVIAIAVALTFVLGLASVGFAGGLDKCNMCHKGDKALDKITAAKKIATAADLVKTVKEGPKAPMHKKFTDDDIKAAATELKLK